MIYKLPASMQKDKLTLVLESTLAQLRDQVQKLLCLGIPAAYLDSAMSKGEFIQSLSERPIVADLTATAIPETEQPYKKPFI